VLDITSAAGGDPQGMGGEGRREGRRAGPWVPAGGTLWQRRPMIHWRAW